MHRRILFPTVLLCITVTVGANTINGNLQQVVDVKDKNFVCNTEFSPNESTVPMGTILKQPVKVQILDIENYPLEYTNIHFISDYPRLATVSDVIKGIELDSDHKWQGNITIDLRFMGKAHIRTELVNTLTNNTKSCGNKLKLTIIRQQRIIDYVFTGSVALLVSLLYIIFGAALDLTILRNLLRRPVGPAIGFLSQFLLMPLLSYGIGYLIFPNSVDMQLGLFFTGVSPSGGASNMWSVILGGNINLSILMTTLSNFAAFGMMPLWIFTLGSLIFARGNMHVPYKNITIFAVSLIVPLAIGLAIQKFSPRITRVLMRLLKPASSCLILFIVIFAIITNLYLFELFSWQIVLGGLLLPWLGYILAWLLAKMLHQNAVDSLTIAIETGIQNTGIAIFLLRFSLPPPQDDLTTVIPVSVAIMTPFPLLGIYLYKKFAVRRFKDNLSDEVSSSIRDASG
uniref:Sodium-bile acid cotransporter n=1 Tax=Glossina brevipalpis TaxID=37001 RepID=A0A1A9WDB0_9MUSC